MYSPLKKGEKFDFIFWNHPFNNTSRKLSDILLKSIFDTNYASLRKYVKGASQHLKKGGRLLLGTADFADWKTMRAIANQNGYAVKILKQKKFKIMKGKTYSARFFIVEFVKIVEVIVMSTLNSTKLTNHSQPTGEPVKKNGRFLDQSPFGVPLPKAL